MSQIKLARGILGQLGRAGVAEVIVCAGARNAPLVALLSRARGVRVYSFFEERSAGFFAIGRMQASGRPVAVITTSGTAAAELLAPVIEAEYQGLPLVVVTADRPKSYRGSGAPQAIVQPGLYGVYVERAWDLEGEHFDEPISWSKRRPIHLNVCFSEPLLDEAISAWDWTNGSATPELKSNLEPPPLQIDSALIVVGPLTPTQAREVYPLIERAQVPVYAEAVSQLRGQFTFEVRDPNPVECQTVVRVGGVPTHRFWRDLENGVRTVHHFSDIPYRGLSAPAQVYPLSEFKHVRFSARDVVKATSTLESRLAEFPRSEPAWVYWLSRKMAAGSRVFLGNSLPIREWDLAASYDFRGEVFANRGTNGIDGLISTAVGVAEANQEMWAVIGDLSALYDLSGPWALRERPLKNFNLVIINNGGGKIFERMFNNPLFENRHDLDFSAWAKMWSFDYVKLETPTPLPLPNGPRVIELVPDAAETAAFWKAK